MGRHITFGSFKEESFSLSVCSDKLKIWGQGAAKLGGLKGIWVDPEVKSGAPSVSHVDRHCGDMRRCIHLADAVQRDRIAAWRKSSDCEGSMLIDGRLVRLTHSLNCDGTASLRQSSACLKLRFQWLGKSACGSKNGRTFRCIRE